MNRREFSTGLLASVTSYALIDSLFAFNAFDRAIKPIAEHWAIQLNEYCADLRMNTISAMQWQKEVDELYKRIELEAIINFIDFDQLIKGFKYPDLGVDTKPVQFPKLEGLPEQTVFVKKIFGMKKDRAIIPHGHSNMSSAHLILKGEMHLRHFEKVRQEEHNLIIKPTIDKIVKKGDSSSISDEKDNVHWFIAHSDAAFTFDVIMLDLNDKPYDIHHVDMQEKQNLPNGMSRVPILNVETALKKYGKITHH